MAGVGRLGRATRRWAASVECPPAAALLVELAKDAADMADRNRVAKDDRLYLSAAARLQQLIERVERDGSRDGGVGAADDVDLAGELGAGPEMVGEVRGEDWAG